MANTTRRGGSGRLALNELHPNSEPPQSTLAAQLVSRITNGGRRHQNQDEETFRQLLKEVLDSERDSSTTANASEYNLDINYKLIYVIVKAGLNSETQENPFSCHDKQTRQVLESLTAINITLRQTPSVLFVSPPVQGDHLQQDVPLLLWLMPKVLALLTTRESEEIRLACEKLLIQALSLEKKLHVKGIKQRSVFVYLQACVSDLISSTEVFIGNGWESPSFSCVLPSQGSILSILPSFEINEGQQKSTTTTIKSLSSAIAIIIRLLKILATYLLGESKASTKTLYNSNMIDWLTLALARIWNLVSQGTTQFNQSLLPAMSFLTYLDTTEHLAQLKAKDNKIQYRSACTLVENITNIVVSVQLPMDASIETALCLNLLWIAYLAFRRPRVGDDPVKQALSSLFNVVKDDVRYPAMGTDLQQTLTFIAELGEKHGTGFAAMTAPEKSPLFQATSLHLKYEELFETHTPDSLVKGNPRPQKRARTSATLAEEKPLLTTDLVSKIYGILKMKSSGGISGLFQEACDYYLHSTPEAQSQILLLLGKVACISALGVRVSVTDNFDCSFCDTGNKGKAPLIFGDDSSLDEIIGLFFRLTKPRRAQKNRRLRVAAMIAATRLLSHTSNESHLNLQTSPLGQMCFGGLRSSIRELRVAARRTLSTFLRESVGVELRLKNRLVALDYLRNLSDQGELPLQETCILACGQMARTVGDGDELNLVLLKLVEYLGHPNAFLCGLAYDELQLISNHSPYTAKKLFAPYWRTVAVVVVQDLQRRPQIAQQVSDLLAMSVQDFLVLTQVHTIPYFVLRKKQDVLQRIADASKQSVMVLCREHNHMAAILSNILLQSSSDVEGLMLSLLSSISHDFSNVDCAELLKSEPQATAAELLKFAGDYDEAKRPLAHQALRFLAGITNGKPLSSRGTRKSDLTGPFFENHVLGIMALLADTINDGKGPQPVLEKRRCLKGIYEMLSIAKSYVGNGLPQICACLRSAIESAELANEGFEAWIAMISLLSEDDIAALIDPTFAIIVRYWDSFDSNVQKKAYDMVELLLKSHSSMIRDVVNTLPSLGKIPLMSKFEEELEKLKDQMDVKHHFLAFSERCQSENATVVESALNELALYLKKHQSYLHEIASSEQPDSVISKLTRSLLDTSVTFSTSNLDIAVLCAHCLGTIGCLDPTRIEAVREKKEILVLSNFTKDDEIRDFIIFFLREVLVKAFLSSTNSRSQGFLAYVMQELLLIGEFEHSVRPRSRDATFDANYRRWVTLPESVRTLLTPFLDSKYFVTAGIAQPQNSYPLYKRDMSHSQWLRTLTFDLLKTEAGDGMIQSIFSILSRIIRFQDISISSFLLPFAVTNVIIDGHDHGKQLIAQELLTVLAHPLSSNSFAQEDTILCSQTVFEVLDYLSRWMQEKKKEIANAKSPGSRASRVPSQAELEKDIFQISSVEAVLSVIPADVISRRAVECRSFARALFHWEQYIRQQRQTKADSERQIDLEPYYERLQEIYTQIDEPDGIEGISAHLQVLNIDQQVLEDRKAGRWTAAQSWYEMLLAERPEDPDVQYNLLTSMMECGQHDVLLNQIDNLPSTPATKAVCLPFATEASWVTGKWDKLKTYISEAPAAENDFNAKIGRLLLALYENQTNLFAGLLKQLRAGTARSLSWTNTASLQECHELMLKFHVLAEIEAISGTLDLQHASKPDLFKSLNQRLEVLGPFVSDKQYILGLRRATMQLSMRDFSQLDIASAWLTSAKLARKGDLTHHACNSALRASQLGDASAMIEHSRLLWKEGNHRKAIRSLEGAISKNAFRSSNYTEIGEYMTTNDPGRQQQQNLLKAKAHLLLAKWIDRAGQTQSDDIVHQYKKAVESHTRWERGHYHLGKHYNKLLESEKLKPPAKQAQTFITGETAKLVIENYIRSLAFGAKYIYQTLPRVLTLWLDLGAESEQILDPKYGNDETFRSHTVAQRRKLLAACNSQMKKYIDRLPAWIFYTALSQIVARICHPNQTVSALLIDVVGKVVMQHSPQALWTLLAVIKSSSKERANRGFACITKTLEYAQKSKSETASAELKAFITQGQRLSDQLLRVCEVDVQGKSANVSLTKDLGFNYKAVASRLAVPIEACLTTSLPTNENVSMKQHKAFSSSDYIHISTFLDEVLVLNSLQKPRKISIRGSDGHVYALLCKPKDDLRKDQRLMEFNAMINRTLKKDAESSKRRLYIKTYGVTPLNEECGLIEWVDNLKTLREILLSSYKQRGIHINYSEIRLLLNESISDPKKLHVFTDRILPHFPPAFHEWFVEMYPEPGSWFTARLRYTRSCAVMSIVGHVLGLGDRHGENILFEEGNGGTFHVDFNCLFDKGLTFEKPELVPFRLTHNMVDAFGAYGYEGPFRKSCELTNRILRQHEDTLMTILETFLYDPTTDFIGKKKRRDIIVPDTPEGVLENVRNKVRGLLPGESVPLSVEGYVDELIKQATDTFKLASMYIGWCPFF